MAKSLAFIVCFFCIALQDVVATPNDDAFFPIWKLLKRDEKGQFIAGYMRAWHDAKKVLDIAVDYVKSNPTQAIDGLQRIGKIYDMQGLPSDSVVRELDLYFALQENQAASLSQAVTAVRSKLGK